MFYQGNLKDYLLQVLNCLQHLIIVLLQNYYYGTKTRVKFNGSCLQQSKISYTHSTIGNIYILFELGASSSHNSDPTLKNCLFGTATLTKNADIDKYKYSGYGNGFDRRSSFSFSSGGFGQNILIVDIKNILIFGVDMSSSAHIDNKKRHISCWKRTNTRIRTYFNCRKNVFHSFHSNKKGIWFKFTLQWSK